MTTLSLYLAMVLATIAPRVPENRRESIARDIASVTLSSDRAFDDDETGQKTALLLVSLAHWETGKSWAEWIDDGRCNDPRWRATHADWLKDGDCDGSKAWSMWQVHVPHDSRIMGRALVRNRQTGIRAALMHARASLQLGTGLCAYSGERYPRCRKADLRLDTARYWAVKFPYELGRSALASE